MLYEFVFLFGWAMYLPVCSSSWLVYWHIAIDLRIVLVRIRDVATSSYVRNWAESLRRPQENKKIQFKTMRSCNFIWAPIVLCFFAVCV